MVLPKKGFQEPVERRRKWWGLMEVEKEQLGLWQA